MKENKYDNLIETPIESIDNDIFDIKSYVEELEDAIVKKAKFIAIDGTHGSGKSSIANAFLKEKMGESDKKVIVNFLNINEESLKFEPIQGDIQTIAKENEETFAKDKITIDVELNNKKIIDNYHRYFVNQVANDLFDNPFEVEKLFYHSFFSIGLARINKKYNKIIDLICCSFFAYSLILISTEIFSLTSYFKIFETYSHFFKIFNPFILILTVVVMVTNGYEIFKPDKENKSPMLNIDKCRNNFAKVIYNKMSQNSKLFLVIDDLDRLNIELQKKIITLLFNEYKPLSESLLIKNVELIFIFMVDITKIKSAAINKKENSNKIIEDINNFDCYKMFDFILPISSNQQHILQQYIKDLTSNNLNLKKWFLDKSLLKNKDYIVGIISRQYTEIRQIKHFFSKIIIKINYLKGKGFKNINEIKDDDAREKIIDYDELIILSILSDICSIKCLSNSIEQKFYNEKLTATDDKNFIQILDSAMKRNIINKNYYLYLYNFSNSQVLMRPLEIELDNYLNTSAYDTNNKYEQVCRIMKDKNVRLEVIFNEIYPTSSDTAKLLLMTNYEFCKFIIEKNGIETIKEEKALVDLYKFKYARIVYENLFKNNKYNSLKLIQNLDYKYNEYTINPTDENYESYYQELKIFIQNLKANIIVFNIDIYFEKIKFNKEIFDLLFNKDIIHNNQKIGYYLLINNSINPDKIIGQIDNDFCQGINKIRNPEKTSLKRKLLLSDIISAENFYTILLSEKYKGDMEEIYEKISKINECLVLESLGEFLKLYGYHTVLDKHFIYNLEQNFPKVVDIICGGEYNLSLTILNKLNESKIHYKYNKYYEEIFKKNNCWTAYFVSVIKRTGKFNIDNELIAQEEYKNMALDLYTEMWKKYWQKYIMTKKFALFIIDNLNLNNLKYNEDNYWKITKLIKYMNEEFIIKLIRKLNEQNKFDDFCQYVIKNEKDASSILFLEKMYLYGTEFNCIKSSTKRNITRNKKKLQMIGTIK